MKVLLVNGSPKPTASASGAILETIRGRLGPDHSYSEVNINRAGQADATCLDQDAILLAFPLYVDGIPSRLLEWLLSFEALSAGTKAAALPQARARTAVFAICNCGFHEGIQTASALRIARNFSRKNGFTWGGGLGIGTGGMIESLAKVPDRVWIKREVSEGIAWIAEGIANWGSVASATSKPTSLSGHGKADDDSLRFVTHAFPRFAYRLAAHAGWRQAAKANGLRASELRARPLSR